MKISQRVYVGRKYYVGQRWMEEEPQGEVTFEPKPTKDEKWPGQEESPKSKKRQFKDTHLQVTCPVEEEERGHGRWSGMNGSAVDEARVMMGQT